MVLPQDYQDKMTELLGSDYDNYLESFVHSIGQSLRVNLLKTEPAELFRRLSEFKMNIGAPRTMDGEEGVPGRSDRLGPGTFSPVPWCPSGAFYEGEDRLSLYPYYQAGLYYIQEPSAMAPASFLPVSPGDRVLDLCAAPGGKTTAIGAKLQGKGLLVANDISISRCKALLKNIELAGIPNAMITCEKPEKLAGYFQGYFDAVLVDAPCSGEGMFRRDPAMIKGWSAKEVLRYQQLQREILFAAADMVRPGGHILYSTCTYSPEENEQVVETLLNERGRQFELIPLPRYEGVDAGHPEWSLSGDPSLAGCARFWNHRVRGEGQFAGLLRKSEEAAIKTSGASGPAIHKKTPGPSGPAVSKKSLPEEFLAFMEHVRWPGISGEAGIMVPERVRQLNERLFLLPEDAPDVKGLRVVSSGLHLGNCKKNRFEPGQALALALTADGFDNVLKLSPWDDRVERYLRCETLELSGKDHSSPEGCPGLMDESALKEGWCLICLEEYPLGWGKVIQGRIKNKYPPGWRR